MLLFIVTPGTIAANRTISLLFRVYERDSANNSHYFHSSADSMKFCNVRTDSRACPDATVKKTVLTDILSTMPVISSKDRARIYGHRNKNVTSRYLTRSTGKVQSRHFFFLLFFVLANTRLGTDYQMTPGCFSVFLNVTTESWEFRHFCNVINFAILCTVKRKKKMNDGETQTSGNSHRSALTNR